MKTLRLALAGVCLAAIAGAATIADGYLAPANGTDIALSTPATAVSGQLITGWVYGDQIVSGNVGQPIWADTVWVDNTSAAPVTFEVYIGMWDATGVGGQPGTILQFADTVPITINPGTHDVFVYSGWPFPSGDFWIGYAFTNVNSLGTTADELNALHFMLSDGPTVGSSNSLALESSGVVGWTSNPPIGSTLGGYLAQDTEFYYAPEPASVLLTLGGIAAICCIRRTSKSAWLPRALRS
ncbi:MAG TPA: hypothetical protein VKB88_33390 [Bryobacteraceae bacterium]|nr:hypothetical protein [Bryobacteraceae bacterium]